MTSEIIQILIENVGVQNIVGRNLEGDKWKVYPFVAPQNEKAPFITVRKTQTEATGAFNCVGTLDFPTYEVRCWSKNYITTEEIHAAGRLALETGAGIYMVNCFDDFDLGSDMYCQVGVYRTQESR